jgi:hypothetical protein
MTDADAPDETMSFKEFAIHIGVGPSYITALKQAGRLVLDEQGKRVYPEASIARMADTAGTRRDGVAARHAKKRGRAVGEATPPAGAPGAPAAPEPEPQTEPLDNNTRAYWERREAAARAELREIELAEKKGSLVQTDIVHRAGIEIGAALRGAMENLDEADVLRGFGGTKTFREFMALFAGDDRAACTSARVLPLRGHGHAQPERIHRAARLRRLPRRHGRRPGEDALLQARLEKADSSRSTRTRSASSGCGSRRGRCSCRSRPTSASRRGLRPAAADVRWHEIPSDHKRRRRRARRPGRCSATPRSAWSTPRARSATACRAHRQAAGDRAEDPDAHRIIWHDLEAERAAIEKASRRRQRLRHAGPRRARARDHRLLRRPIQELAAKPVIARLGCNFQRHCWWAIFLGIGFKFNDFIQAIHRIQRFLQTHRCAST